MRVLAIDPSLRGTGFAVLEKSGQKIQALVFGVIKNPDKLLASSCLVAIRERLAEVILSHSPESAAIESTIFVQSHRTAIALGAARGAAILAAAERGLPIYEYAPRSAKQAVVGRGAANKEQVIFMVRAMLGLTENPPHDAADAMAIGITHFQSMASMAIGAKTQARI